MRRLLYSSVFYFAGGGSQHYLPLSGSLLILTRSELLRFVVLHLPPIRRTRKFVREVGMGHGN